MTSILRPIRANSPIPVTHRSPSPPKLQRINSLICIHVYPEQPCNNSFVKSTARKSTEDLICHYVTGFHFVVCLTH